MLDIGRDERNLRARDWEVDDAAAVMVWIIEWSARGFRGDRRRSFENSALGA